MSTANSASSAPISFTGIDHVQLSAPPGSEAEARRFFGEVLGLQELKKPDSLAARGGCWFGCGVHQIHIGIEADFSAARKAHPALRLTDHASFLRLRDRLRAAGVEVRDDEPVVGLERFSAHDPWGNRIEFVCGLA